MSIRFRALAVLAAGSLLAGCSAGPVSQATTLPATAVPVEEATPSSSAQSSTAAAGSPAAPTASPASPPSPAVIPTGVPPKPGDPTWKLVKETPKAGGGSTVEYEVTWTAPEGIASEFLAYGVTECLRSEKKYNGKPCLVPGMKIARSTLDLIGRAPGDARKMTVTWDQNEVGPSLYWSILLRATNSFGDSIFTIVHSEDVCYGCTY
jgi:hypothetical protein